MTPQEVLTEIYKLPLNDQQAVAQSLSQHLLEKNGSDIPQDLEQVYQKFRKKLVEDGFLVQIPSGITESEDDFEPIEIKGEPISETIIRERR